MSDWKEYFGETPDTNKAAYIIEVDGVDYEVAPANLCRRMEGSMREYRDHLGAIERWNEREDDDKIDWDNYGHALELLHNRHSKMDLARLICDLLSGKTPKVLK